MSNSVELLTVRLKSAF